MCRFDDTADDSLGHARAGVAFVDGTVAPYPGPSATMHKASAASAEGNLRVPMEAFPQSESPRTFHSQYVGLSLSTLLMS